jgi:hypothetical protein
MDFSSEELTNLIGVIIWPLVSLVAILVLRRPLITLLNRISSSSEVNMSVGSLSIQAKAMREIHDSIGVGFAEGMIDKKSIEALIDTKIRSIQSAIEYEATRQEIRDDPRLQSSELIKIVKEDGSVIDGETLDISNAGIGFKSKGRLNFHETVQIVPSKEDAVDKNPVWEKLKIVRIEESHEDFHYGATAPSLG